jgi:serine phosphatase RsbU (regulator of sigma subunit)
MSEDHGNDEQELRRLRSEVASQRRDIHDLDDLEHRQEELIARLREAAAVREGDPAALRERLAATEHELQDLRGIRDALTPPELPQRPGLELAAAFLPAIAEQVSGDFYLVAEGRRIRPCSSAATSSATGCRRRDARRSSARHSPRPHHSPTIPPAC